MALDMFLEIEGCNPDWNALENAMISTGVENFENTMAIKEENKFLSKHLIKEVKFRGDFAKSHSLFYVCKSENSHDIISEGNHNCDFKVQYTIVFRVNNAYYDEFVKDIHNFLRTLAGLSSMQFVLSFQYEEVRAIRNKVGFEFFWNMPK
ncbi:hypothetical protein PMI16_04608 [Herbaspirillum sp. CF444]|uniref:hypothetical protein n=1 Tax=Herbaspirillum sp. CF444 TaxID=1144319 RepID=UPI0002727F15|nr:hypothetical protein [Herbaspirillum sp. CF444]EJL81753.1 hypothetical protein PMI16_04608 [Herbaspirillum sp. CF444]